ncbi:hypothetical protein [Paraflavitalea sp. CAU 1676]|uniref:hypothetical protein n=1 Tax=Paraflavitalea sp. CAU 1676 TaxID=3032598 RepID=UPI0023DCAAC4|nr:hypothetical protein [Paraflavitalea sp. CAU 1676]MDF2190892.1 hypothetical protein [Paraflavitalea sp. CAU 1676]
MKKIVFLNLIALSVILVSPSCGGKGGDPKPCSETALQVTTTPANGTTEPAAPGPNFPLQVNITANLPSAGVSIEVKAEPDAGGSAFFTQTLPDVKTNISNFTITNTPSGAVSKVTITVTSKSCASNKWTGGYRYSKK